MMNLRTLWRHKCHLLTIILSFLLIAFAAGCSMPGSQAPPPRSPEPTPTPVPTPLPPPNCENLDSTFQHSTFFRCAKDEKITFTFEHSAANMNLNFGFAKPPSSHVPINLGTVQNDSLPVTIDAAQNVFIQQIAIQKGDITSIKIADSNGQVFFQCAQPNVNFPNGCLMKAGAAHSPLLTVFHFSLK